MTDKERIKVIRANWKKGNNWSVMADTPWLIKRVEELEAANKELKDYLDVVIESNQEQVFKLTAQNKKLEAVVGALSRYKANRKYRQSRLSDDFLRDKEEAEMFDALATLKED